MKRTLKKIGKTAKPKARSPKAGKGVKSAAAPLRSAKAKRSWRAAAKRKGLSILELFQLKTRNLMKGNRISEAWKQRKSQPFQEQHRTGDSRAKGTAARRSGFGGTRHH
jgi:hypothetical protein